MTRRALVLVLAACAFAVPVHADAPTSPYAGQQTRTIKALSPEDVAALAAVFEKRYGIRIKTGRASSETILQRIIAESRAGRAEFDVVETISPELERHRRETREHFVSSITRGLDRLAERGVAVGVDPRLASAALAGAAHDLLLEWLLNPSKTPIEHLADTIATLWVRALKLDPAGRFALN